MVGIDYLSLQTGDPTCKARRHEVHLSEAFKHLEKYGDKGPDGEQRWRFASHPQFPYWALNMKQRHQVLSQSRIYQKQNASLPTEELREMVGESPMGVSFPRPAHTH